MIAWCQICKRECRAGHPINEPVARKRDWPTIICTPCWDGHFHARRHETQKAKADDEGHEVHWAYCPKASEF